jgi:SPP1 family phage portal protein
MSRRLDQIYPDYTAELRELNRNGFSLELLYKIINKHKQNSIYNRKLYERYMTIDESVPIMRRNPRFKEENPINNKINNDFFSEIVDFKTGYFAGKPIAYGYNKGEEAEETTGGESGVDEATKLITDFTTRNNMYGVDMEVTKNASICGYSGRLFYVDKDGEERVMSVPAYQTIILSSTDISEPEYAVRYFYTLDINKSKVWTVEFYDNTYVTTYTGYLTQLTEIDKKPHMFDYCPLQGIPNNSEMLGDAEKVLSLIDDYDKVVSDNSNEIESFVHAYLVFENLNVAPDVIKNGQKSGTFQFRQVGTQEGKMYFLTKDINDAYTEHHLERLEDNIYRFSKTPNLGDESFGTASGVSLKFKLHGLETKCGMYQAQMMNAAQFMWKLLASAWAKKGEKIDPLQVTMDFKRNFPLDTATEAQTVQTLISAGIPKEVAYSQLSFVDDVDYVLELIEQEQESIQSLYDVGNDNEQDDEQDESNNFFNKKEDDEQDDEKEKNKK